MSKARGPYRVDPLGYKKANEALDKMAENAKELGLDYELQDKDPDLIEQPAQQEPLDSTQISKVWWDGEKLMAKPIPFVEFYKPAPVAKPHEQEPVAWRDHVNQRLRTWRQSFVNRSGDQLALDDFMDKRSLDDLIDFVCDEYTFPPPQRTWVGLTDEEIEARAINFYNPEMYKRAVLWAQEKLKERNQ